ncbi:putative zinc-binding protein [Chitinimonas koreensis]|uniref:putative zinc-binding protein n=1 Tax=Chitinimonas koreensis TaxID=356302 RepID=UPI0003F68281|nr:putative zinc-binding protein [Chitinimonas koreensis]QNM95138.1 zinc-binding protein [Chitinimonas koreensis]
MNPLERPLVYACSGCSSVAQLANDLAIALDRQGEAEMSCISGVGGGVPMLVKLARSGRPILALDGCALACVAACLGNAGVQPDVHLVLNRLGAKKRYHSDCADEERQAVWLTVSSAARDLRRVAGRGAEGVRAGEPASMAAVPVVPVAAGYDSAG